MKIKDGRVGIIGIRDATESLPYPGKIVLYKGDKAVVVSTDPHSHTVSIKQNGKQITVSAQDIERYGDGKQYEGKPFSYDNVRDSIAEGSKIVVNTENHVNENAIAVSVNEDNCLVRFENGDEETVPIESISAFESTANDASAPKDFFDLDEWKIKAKSLGYIVENNSQRGLWVARVGIREMGTYNPLKGGTLYTDQSSTETESQIAELTKNMDAARARGYDNAPYQKEIARLKSMDANYRQLGAQGIYIVSRKYGLPRVGQDVDYYGENGDKQYGIVLSVNNNSISIRNAHTKKNERFKVQFEDKYTGDPLTEKGKEIMAALKEQYGEEKGEQVFYAMKNSGQIEGID